MREARRRLTARERSDASEAIAHSIVCSSVFAQAATILAYWPMPEEADIGAVISQALALEKRVALPRCSQGAATFVPVEIVDPAAELEPGPFPGLLQPRADLPEKSADHPFDLALVPGVAFDRNGGRLGFGAGMYDRFLAHHCVSFLLGVAFDLQITAAIPTEPHDQRMDAIVSETEWIEV